MAAAISLASRICQNDGSYRHMKPYEKLFDSEGVDRAFLYTSFNSLDYQSWRHAYLFQQIARNITKGDPLDAKAIFVAVERRIAPKEPADSAVLWPMHIWDRRAGLCDRQAWVACELAYQCGWETQIVNLMDPKTGVSPHTVCEFRRKPDLADFVDVHKHILLEGKSVDQVLMDKPLLASLWPGNPELRPALQRCLFWCPSFPQDYCPRNQSLHTHLARVLGDACPRFGEDPATLRRQIHASAPTCLPATKQPIEWAPGSTQFACCACRCLRRVARRRTRDHDINGEAVTCRQIACDGSAGSWYTADSKDTNDADHGPRTAPV